MVLTVTFPDGSARLVGALSTGLPADTWVGIRKPTALTSTGWTEAARSGSGAVVVRANGGPAEGQVLRAQSFGFTVWAPTEAAATDLAEQAVTLVSSLEYLPGNGITSVDIQSAPSPLVDDSLIPCRYFTAQLYVRGT